MGALTKGRTPRRIVLALVGCGVAAALVGLAASRLSRTGTAHASPPPSVPVIATTAGQRDVPIYFDALGTVMAFNTVSIRAQVTGQIVSVNFRQGQDVKKGDVIAKIDPDPFRLPSTKRWQRRPRTPPP